MKRIFTLLTFLFLSNLMFAQKNVVKLNVTRLFTLKAEVAYERTFARQFSFQLGGALQVPVSKVPGLPSAAQKSIDTTFGNFNYSGYWITPELRVYLNPVKGSPKGIYLSIFGRLNNRIMNIEYNNRASGADFVNVKARFNVSGVGGGLMLGHQWIIGKHVSLDLYIFGIGVNKHTATLKIADGRFTEQEYKDLAEDINTDESSTPLFSKPVATAEGQSLSMKMSSVFPLIRSLGFNVGVAF